MHPAGNMYIRTMCAARNELTALVNDDARDPARLLELAQECRKYKKIFDDAMKEAQEEGR